MKSVSNMRAVALRGPAFALLVLGFASLSVAGCDGDMPKPRYAQQKTGALQLVGYPPPPPRVEFIPARPPGRPVWLDGEWSWSGSKWAWTKGKWVVPPPGSTFSPWTTVRDDRGNVYFAGGTWNDGAGNAIAAPPTLAQGRSMPGDVTSPEGDDEKTGPSHTPPPSSPSLSGAQR